MIDQESQELIEASVLCWLATSSADGQPRVSPKEIFALIDERTVVIANVASPGSAANLRVNASVCLSILEIFRQKGVQLMGTARIHKRGEPRFSVLAEPLEVLAGDGFPFSSLFEVTVTSVRSILAPRYRFYPETTEQEQIERAMDTYGVRPGAHAERRVPKPC